ncbi:MAG: hypothetical protein JWM36_4378 [Hyphomicrobiales bacterium]|nr:hypothetical protein [Hyphomicrobiales bacterium]
MTATSQRPRVPRKTKAEAGVPGVDRAPMRLWRTAERYTRRSAVWVGEGSPWANPWVRAPQAVQAAYIAWMAPPLVQTGKGKSYRLGTPVQMSIVLRGLFRIWLAREDIGPSRLGLEFARVLRPCPDDAPALISEPWSHEEIRTALRGRDLVDGAPLSLTSHADVLLTIANAVPASPNVAPMESAG